MKIELFFANIVDAPCCAVALDNTKLYQGPAVTNLRFDLVAAAGAHVLYIEHFDKRPEDTVVDAQGQIVRDRSFELIKISIDGLDIQELIWQSEFLAVDGQRYPSCLFFGPNGRFILPFESPVLAWMLQTRHQRDGDDPTWAQDLEYYLAACRRLQQISQA